LVLSHENGAQIVVGPGRQAPAPSHTLTPISAAPWQVPLTQTTPGT